jgi:hypothetical protein
MSCDDFFGKNSYVHKRSGRKVVRDVAKSIFGPRQIPSGMMSGGPDGR